jgi:hypothetical protein
MALLDVRKLARSALERVKLSEKAADSDPSVVHLKDAVVRSMAELEVSRVQRITSNPDAPPPSSDDSQSEKDKPKLPSAA